MAGESRYHAVKILDRLILREHGFRGVKMNVFLSALLLAVAMPLFAEEIYQVRPNGERDYTKPSFKRDGNEIYQQRQDGSRAYNKPSYVIKGDAIYQQRPNGEPDYTKPSQKVR